MESSPRREAPQKRGAHYRPILCRTLDEETGLAIEALVAAGFFHSVAAGVGLLAQEGLARSLREKPELYEVIRLHRRMRGLLNCD